MIKRVNESLEEEINNLLDMFTLEELFERCDITPEEVIEFLVNNGMIELPDYGKT